MKGDLAQFLEGLIPLATETAVWGNGRFPLEITYYLSSKLPPLAYVSSVRAVVFREGELLTVLDPNGDYYIIPGGRWEKGESVEEALCRELLEETGWTVRDTVLLGVIHYHHLSPRPEDYPYSHPDFLQLVYVATAEQFIPEAIEFDQYVVESRFWRVQEIRPLLKNQAQLALLDAALTHFAGML